MARLKSDHYATLGVSRSAATEEVHQAYRQLAKRYHPDAPSGDAENFKILSEAHRVLTDPKRRARYDLTLNGKRAGYNGSVLQGIFDSYFSSYFAAISLVYATIIIAMFFFLNPVNFILISASLVVYGCMLFLLLRRIK
jgi:DnaJ-class molecular chaperone